MGTAVKIPEKIVVGQVLTTIPRIDYGWITMEDDSEHWTSLETLEYGGEAHKQAIEKDQPAKLRCTINTAKFATGRQNVIFRLDFPALASWVVRIRLPEDDPDSAAIESSMLSEIATMTLIGQKTSIPVPGVWDFDVNEDNPFGFRYLLMECLPGRHLESGFSKGVPEHHMDRIISQFSDIYYQLSRLRFASIGHVWMGEAMDQEPHIVSLDGTRCFGTSLEYFYALRREHTKAIQTDHPDDEKWATAAWILEQALPSMIVEDRVYGPFPLCHMDLHYNNTLVDEDYNITGIIDWTNAQTVPLERLLITPEFTIFPGLSAEENAPKIRFRQRFAAALRARELAGVVPSPDSSHPIGDEEDPIVSGTQELTEPPALISDMLNNPLWEIVYRCVYTFHWRAMADSRLVMRQMYGSAAKWDDFVEFHRNGPIHRNKQITSTAILEKYRV